MEGSSSQLLYEQLERLRLQDHQFVEQLDREERAARESHLRGLEEAKSLHETVRQTAELEHKAFLQEFESQQRKALEEAQARILRQKEQEIEDERKRAELDAQLRKQEEEKRRLAEERQRRAQAEAEAEAAAKREAERKAQEEATRKAKEEADRKAKEEAERKAKEEAAKAEATRKSQQAAVSTPAAAPAPAPAPTPSAVPPTAPSLPDKESLHKEYLALHQRLKAFRNEIKKLRLSDEQFKKDAFEGRTGITTRIGQIRGVKGGYKEPTVKVLEALKGALTSTRHTYDVRKLVIQSSPLSQQPQPIMVSLLFVYMLHILGKCIVSQFIKEGSTNSKIADNVGIGAITIFSDPALKCGNVALVDMLLAKIHRLCPVIFGIYGSERTAQGRARLGWREFDNQQTFNGIIAGISTGYGALFLRDLTKMKTPRDNPFPNSDFWLAISRIVNTPPAEVTETHLIALKALVSSHAEKFIRLYGYMGKVALRHALLVFPTSVEQKYPIAAGSLKVLREYMKKDAHITL